MEKPVTQSHDAFFKHLFIQPSEMTKEQ